MKSCRVCNQEKSLDQFYKHSECADRHMSICKICFNIRSKEYREKNSEKEKERGRRYRENHKEEAYLRGKRWREENPEKYKEKDKRYYKKNTEKIKARIATRNLIKQPCEVCNSTKNIHAHHEDYAKPLDVIWLCRTHHDDLHFGRLND